MKLNFRKVASVLASAAMLGSTFGIAAAANYPDPFVKGGVADVAVVVGANALGADMVGAGNIASDLQYQLALQTATTGTGGATASTEYINLGKTGTKKLFMGDALTDSGITSVSKAHLAITLGDGKIVDKTGVEYPYTQSLTLGGRTINYTKVGTMTDPAILINVGTSSNIYLYKVDIGFSKSLNVSDTANVQGVSTINIMGKSYVIGATSTNATLILYESGVTTTVDTDTPEKTVEVAGVSHTAKLVSVADATNARIEIDGESKTVVEGSTYKIGGIDVYIKDVFYGGAAARGKDSVELSLAAKRLKLQNAQSVKTGPDGSETTMLGTNITLNGETGNKIGGFSIDIALQDSTKSYIQSGDSFVDPVFGGIEFKFSAYTPETGDSARDNVEASAADITTNVKLNSYLDTQERTFTYARDRDGEADADYAPLLADASNYTIRVLEGENANLLEYVIVNNGDDGRILQVTGISVTGSTSDKIDFKDVLTSEALSTSIKSDGTGDLWLSGKRYFVNATGSGSSGKVSLRWGSGATATSNGAATTLFPRIKLKKGEWLAFLVQTNITNTTVYSLPGVEDVTTYEAGAAYGWTGGHNLGYGLAFGNLNWTINASDNNSATTGRLVAVGTAGGNGTIGPQSCAFSDSVSGGPAILILEEHKYADTNGAAICIPMSTYSPTAGSVVQANIGQPIALKDTFFELKQHLSDITLKKGVDKYGTLVVFTDRTTLDTATVKYPDTQAYADILVTAKGAEITVTTGGTVSQLGQVVIEDNLVDSVKAKNLIVIGGACINEVAQKLLGASAPLCGAAWTEETGVGDGQYLIKAYESPYNTAKIAVLVAGWEAADTKAAATYLTANKPSTVKEAVVKKVTATGADVV